MLETIVTEDIAVNKWIKIPVLMSLIYFNRVSILEVNGSFLFRVGYSN